MAWLIENFGTIVAGGILVAVIGLVLYNMIRNKKKGKSSCGCGCSACPAAGSCHKAEKKSMDDAIEKK